MADASIPLSWLQQVSENVGNTLQSGNDAAAAMQDTLRKRYEDQTNSAAPNFTDVSNDWLQQQPEYQQAMSGTGWNPDKSVAKSIEDQRATQMGGNPGLQAAYQAGATPSQAGTNPYLFNTDQYMNKLAKYDPQQGGVVYPHVIEGPVDPLANILSMVAQYGTQAAMGGAFAPLFGSLGALGGGLLKTGLGALQSGHFDPMSLLGTIGGNFGIPPQLMQVLQMGMGLAKGGKPNPASLISQAPALAKLLAGQFTGG